MTPLLTPVRRAHRWAALVLAVVSAAGLAGSFGAGVAHAADNTLVGSTPADGASMPTSPVEIVLRFANPLGSTNQVTVACDGTPVAVGPARVGADTTTLTVGVPTPLPKGECVVSWAVSAADGSPAGSSSFGFTVAADTTAATTTTPTATTSPGSSPASSGSTAGAASSNTKGPLGLSRLAISLALACLFGALVLIAVAWPEGVEYVLTVRFLRWVWFAAVASAVFNVICLAASLPGNTFGSSLSPAAWSDLTDHTAGVAALARLALVVACGWVVTRPERAIDPATQLPALLVPGLAVATLGFSRTGGDLAAIGVLAGVVHALAMAVWVGGLVLLARVVLAGPGDDDLVHAVRGFSRLSNPAILLTVGSGLVQLLRLDRGTLFDTGHGYVLLLKVLVVLGMWFVAWASRQFIRARLATAESMAAPMAVRLRRAIGIEALIGVVVLALSAWLLALSPGGIAEATSTIKGLGAVQRIADAETGVDVKVQFSQVVGKNAVRVEVVKPATGVVGLVIDFIAPPDSGAASVRLHVPLTGAGVAELGLDDGLPLGVAGTWTLSVTINNTPIGQKNVEVNEP